MQMDKHILYILSILYIYNFRYRNLFIDSINLELSVINSYVESDNVAIIKIMSLKSALQHFPFKSRDKG